LLWWLGCNKMLQLRSLKELIEHLDKRNTFVTRGKFCRKLLIIDDKPKRRSYLTCSMWDDLLGFVPSRTWLLL
jgi:hypothetical protein